jgi:hypothetical protein
MKIMYLFIFVHRKYKNSGFPTNYKKDNCNVIVNYYCVQK